MIKTSTMRQADRWLGVPVCFGLTAVRRVLGYFDRAAGREPPRRILFVKLVEQGSSVLACSAIRRAIGLVGRENVYFLVFEENRFILDAMRLLPSENVIAIRTAGLISAALDALHDMVTTPDSQVYVHCVAGLVRSPTILWLYLISLGVPWKDAREWIQKRSPLASAGSSRMVDHEHRHLAKQHGRAKFLPLSRPDVIVPYEAQGERGAEAPR